MENRPPPLRRRLATRMLPRVLRIRPDFWSLLPAACVLKLFTLVYPQYLTSLPARLLVRSS